HALFKDPVGSHHTDPKPIGGRGVSSVSWFISMRCHKKRAGDVVGKQFGDRYSKLLCQPDSVDAARSAAVGTAQRHGHRGGARLLDVTWFVQKEPIPPNPLALRLYRLGQRLSSLLGRPVPAPRAFERSGSSRGASDGFRNSKYASLRD